MHYRNMKEKGYEFYRRVVRMDVIRVVQTIFSGETHAAEQEQRRIASIGEIVRTKFEKMAPGEARSRVDAFLSNFSER